MAKEKIQKSVMQFIAVRHFDMGFCGSCTVKYNNGIRRKAMYRRISIDISGFCNAKCRWCVTGWKNRQQGFGHPHYMSYEMFVRVYEHLYQKQIIDINTEIMLYSWGEPFLNKDYIGIVEYLADKGQVFAVSTNASNVQLLNGNSAYKNCDIFIFSMPGFSQASYDHIHGFNFEQIKRNIEIISKNLWESGFNGTGMLSFHVYKFNTHEIEAAKQFARSLKLEFNPYYPYFNGNSMSELYLEGKMPNDMRVAAEEELYLSHVKELLGQRPKDYRCFLENILSIDCDGNLTLCCASDSGCADYIGDNIFEITSYEEMKTKRQEMLCSDTCKRCRKLGIDYWMGNNPPYTMGEV